MLFTIAVHHGASWLLVVATGPVKLCDTLGVIDLAARIAREQGYRRILLDLLAVEPMLSFGEHLRLGEHIGKAFGALDRVATAVADRYRVGTSERAAQARGAPLRTFTDIREAEVWLGA